MGTRILLVEDEINLLNTIRLNLELEGYEVITADTGTRGLQAFHRHRYHLIILDVMLPEMDGLNLCRLIRAENREVPLLFLTAKGSSEDKVEGLKSGADDYLTKPFHLEEFLLRVRGLLRRGQKPGDAADADTFQFNGNEIRFATFEIRNRTGEVIPLSKKEIALLRLLTSRKNEVVSREQILENVWGYDVYPSPRTIDNYILAFRKYFEENPKEPRYFHSIRGVGYKFTEA
jgi:two-component system alkaline phosphatase synthesis response regulator PhoP